MRLVLNGNEEMIATQSKLMKQLYYELEDLTKESNLLVSMVQQQTQKLQEKQTSPET